VFVPIYACPSITHEPPNQFSQIFLLTFIEKVLYLSMTPKPPLTPRVIQTLKSKQVTGEKSLCYQKCPNGNIYTFCQNELLYFCLIALMIYVCCLSVCIVQNSLKGDFENGNSIYWMENEKSLLNSKISYK